MLILSGALVTGCAQYVRGSVGSCMLCVHFSVCLFYVGKSCNPTERLSWNKGLELLGGLTVVLNRPLSPRIRRVVMCLKTCDGKG